MRQSQRAEARPRPGDQPGERIIEQADLFSLLEGTRTVGDRDLDRPVAPADEFDQQLPVEIEAVAGERQSAEAFAAEDLVHGEGILQPDSEGEVDEQREGPMGRVQYEGLHRLIGEPADRPAGAAVT